MKKYFALTLIFSFIAGCANVTSLKPHIISTDEVKQTSYKLNVPLTRYIGDPIINKKDYRIIVYSPKVVEVMNDLNVQDENGNHVYSGKAHTRFKIIGQAFENNTKNYLIKLYNPYMPIIIGIDSTGNYSGLTIGPMSRKIARLSFTPENVKFRYVNSNSIDSNSPYINYEIIFTGMTNQSINLLYREYTLDNLAKPAFYQNLSYPTNTKIIRFKKLKIQVHKIDNQQIHYTVVEDL